MRALRTDRIWAPQPTSWWHEALVELWDHLPGVAVLSLAFTLGTLPAWLALWWGWVWLYLPLLVLLVAPAWALLLWGEARLCRYQACVPGPWRLWARASGLGAVCAFPLCALLVTLPALSGPEVAGMVWVGLAADIVGVCLAWCLASYGFPLLVLRGWPWRRAVVGAMALASRHVAYTLGLLSLCVGCCVLLLLVSSGLMFFLPGAYGMFSLVVCLRSLEAEMGGGT